MRAALPFFVPHLKSQLIHHFVSPLSHTVNYFLKNSIFQFAPRHTFHSDPYGTYQSFPEPILSAPSIPASWPPGLDKTPPTEMPGFEDAGLLWPKGSTRFSRAHLV